MKKISLTENALENHGELFPNHESKLQETDPEFIEIFDNWAFDEVIRQSKLDVRTRVLMILGSTIASQALGEFRIMVGAALNVGLTPVEIKEVIRARSTRLGSLTRLFRLGTQPVSPKLFSSHLEASDWKSIGSRSCPGC